jgi:hypothetical protein
MSNEFLGDGQDDSGENQESGKALRQFGRDQQARANKLEQELNELKVALAKRDAESIFSKLGVPEKVRKFYSGDPTEDAIKDWVKVNADVFGIEGEVAPTPEQTETQTQIAAVQQAQSLGEDRSQSWTRDSMAQKRQGLLANGTSLADLNEVLAAFGVPDVPVSGPMM